MKITNHDKTKGHNKLKGQRQHHRNKTQKNTTSTRTYTKDELNSGDGMLTSVWGPPLWLFLHVMSFNYPVHPTDEDKQHYMDVILNLQNVLPCKYCRINLKTNFKNLPLSMECMENRDTFSKYIYDLHELINKMLGKQSGLTYDDVRDRYENFRARCNKTDKKPKMAMAKTLKAAHKKGCTEPLVGEKAKTIIRIVPHS
jgi:hypothetical protein